MRQTSLKTSRPSFLVALAALGMIHGGTALTGCADAGTNDDEPAPDLFESGESGEDVPLERGTFVGDFIIHTKPRDRKITIERARPSAPMLGTESIDPLNVGSDEVPGTGTPNTVELVTNSTGVNTECPGPYTNKTFCANVTLRHFYERSLPNSFVQLTSADPPAGHNAVNSDPSEFGLTNSYGLWKYKATAAAVNGLLGQAPFNDGSKDWIFNNPDDSDTSYQIRVISSLSYSNYTAPFQTLTFVDACSGGTDLLTEPYAEIEMPFPFTLYGSTSALVKIAETGMVTFGNVDPVNDGDNVALPSTAAPRPAIFSFWDDISLGADGHMCYKTTGTAPNRKFVITWNKLSFNDPLENVGTQSSLTFGLILSEGVNKIDLIYSSMVGSTTRKNGASATIGVQNETGTVATSKFNSATFTTGKKYPLSPIP
jgi:hypothetical protein